jgi:hypothetical protein
MLLNKNWLFYKKNHEAEKINVDLPFDAMLRDETEAGDRFREEWDKMFEAYKTYDVIYLGCFCHEDESCHGDIIKKKLLQRSMKEKLDSLKNIKKA